MYKEWNKYIGSKRSNAIVSDSESSNSWIGLLLLRYARWSRAWWWIFSYEFDRTELWTFVNEVEARVASVWTVSGKDFENSIQYFSAIQEGCEVLITRNKKDFPKLGLQVLTPAKFLKNLQRSSKKQKWENRTFHKVGMKSVFNTWLPIMNSRLNMKVLQKMRQCRKINLKLQWKFQKNWSPPFANSLRNIEKNSVLPRLFEP